MSFSLSVAITRLDGGLKSAFQAGTTAGQKLQLLNELLERFYTYGDWRGLHDTISLTPVSGIISLPAAYVRLDGLGEPSTNINFDILPMSAPFASGAFGVMDYTTLTVNQVIDQGDVSGVRKYLVAGNATTNDARTFTGYARKRYVWATDTATVVYPDSFEAIRRGVAAMNAETEGDEGRYQEIFQSALNMLDQNLNEFEAGNDPLRMQLEPITSPGQVWNIL